MGKIFRGETQIVIPEDTLVLICGSQNSGKTTFTQKHFAGKSIVTTDEIFEDVVKNQSTILDTMDSLTIRTTEIFEERVIRSGKECSITVVDAAPIDFEGRLEMLRRFKGLHTNIILIVLDVKYPTLVKRPKKTIDKKKKQFGITPICDEELLLNSLLILEQIRNNQFGYRVNRAYILSEADIKKCQVTFE